MRACCGSFCGLADAICAEAQAILFEFALAAAVATSCIGAGLLDMGLAGLSVDGPQVVAGGALGRGVMKVAPRYVITCVASRADCPR